jgi:hypothetical protein
VTLSIFAHELRTVAFDNAGSGRQYGLLASVYMFAWKVEFLTESVAALVYGKNTLHNYN